MKLIYTSEEISESLSPNCPLDQMYASDFNLVIFNG